MPRAKPDIDKLAYTLGLNEYQTHVLKQNYGKYDVCHLVLRGGVYCMRHAIVYAVYLTGCCIRLPRRMRI